MDSREWPLFGASAFGAGGQAALFHCRRPGSLLLIDE